MVERKSLALKLPFDLHMYVHRSHSHTNVHHANVLSYTCIPTIKLYIYIHTPHTYIHAYILDGLFYTHLRV